MRIRYDASERELAIVAIAVNSCCCCDGILLADPFLR
jgi:hypothetical protein